MKTNRAKKEQIISEIADKIKSSKSVIVFDYHKLNVENITNIRNELTKNNIELIVYKNRLVKKACEIENFADINEYLKGPNAFVFSKDDPLLGAKILAKFSKQFPSIILQAAIYENKILNQQEITELSLLPSKEELLAMFANSLQYSLRTFAATVKAIADSKA